MTKHTDLGDRMKAYELASETRLNPLLPFMARCDGRGFSKLTKHLDKPAIAFNECMIHATKHLAKHTHADLSYTQSDEITLVFLPTREYIFDGRVQKIASVVASMASVAFNQTIAENLPALSHNLPVFDCRVYQVPDVSEAANALLWRVRDATKNASSMVARAHFSHKSLDGKSTRERIQMLADHGISFENDYPDLFRNGSFWSRKTVQRTLTEQERMNIPEKYRPDETELVMRSIVERVPMPPHINYSDIMSCLENVK